jgi:DNA-binding NarL/FixJ family response regulator
MNTEDTRMPPNIAAQIAPQAVEDPLTSRELDVLRRVAAGNSNKLIAAVLEIAESTVKAHMKNILLKLNAIDRSHAVMIAIERGFLNV